MNEHGYPEISDDTDIKVYGESLVKMIEIRDKAKMKLLLEMEYNHLKTEMYSNKDTDDPYMRRLQWLNTKILESQKQKPSSKYYWVTVSPKPQTSLESLRVKVEKYVRSRMIQGCIYTYEKRPSDGTPHVHLIVKPIGVSDSDFRKRTKNPFKDLVGNNRCIDIKICPESFLGDKIEYIKGNKWDVSKDEACDEDKVFRLENELEPYYVVGNIIESVSEDDDGGD